MSCIFKLKNNEVKKGEVVVVVVVHSGGLTWVTYM